MVKPKRVPGPRNTLLEGDAGFEALKKAIAAEGYKSISQAAIAVGFQPNVLIRILREGLPANPRINTVERLTKLGVYELLKKRHAG